MVFSDADGWNVAMDQEMANLKSHGVCKLVPRMNGMWTLKLGWVSHWKVENGVSIRVDSLHEATTNALVSIAGNRCSP